MAYKLAMSRSSSQPSPIAHQARVFLTQPHAYYHNYGPPQPPQHDRYYSEVPVPVVKMEPQSEDQLDPRQYQLGYQATHSPRNDWPTMTTPPMVQQPIGILPEATARRRIQSAENSAQGFQDDSSSSTSNPFLAGNTQNSRVGSTRRSDGSAANVVQLNPFKRRKFQPSLQGNHDLKYQNTFHYAQPRHQGQHQFAPSSHSSQLTSSTREYFGPDSAMSLTYETAQFMSEANYPRMHDPQEQEEMQHEHPRYPSPPMPSGEMNPYNHPVLDTAQEDAIENLPQLQSPSVDPPSPGRSKPIPKPDREIVKNENGRYVCSWAGCTEEIQDFGRKCEWSKHMDKHDRPYKCAADGCEKLPGFTYSGGLLRHEREVHGKHGGPRKQLNCPHSTCKRHTGKGFSRQENLNEHLRRVHTSDGTLPEVQAAVAGAEVEEEGLDSKTGTKRKRAAPHASNDNDIREELKRLRVENEELRRNSDLQNAQTAEMMAQIRQLQSAVVSHPRMPSAPMM